MYLFNCRTLSTVYKGFWVVKSSFVSNFTSFPSYRPNIWADTIVGDGSFPMKPKAHDQDFQPTAFFLICIWAGIDILTCFYQDWFRHVTEYSSVPSLADVEVNWTDYLCSFVTNWLAEEKFHPLIVGAWTGIFIHLSLAFCVLVSQIKTGCTEAVAKSRCCTMQDRCTLQHKQMEVPHMPVQWKPHTANCGCVPK